MKPATVSCKAKLQGTDGVKLEIKIRHDGFGKFDGDLHWLLDSPEMRDVVFPVVESADKRLDGMVINNQADMREYVALVGEILTSLLSAIHDKVGADN